MAYIGSQPTVGSIVKLNNISSGFNGSTTTFQLALLPGDVSYYFTPGSAYQLIVSLNNVIKNPDVDYIVNGSQITFTTAPASGLSCFIIALGQSINVGTPGAGTVTTSTLATSIAPTVSSINGGQVAGTRNRVINGGMAIDQRNAGATLTFVPAAALAYAVDRWYGYCSGNYVDGTRTAGATAGQYRYQFTGAASVTAIGFGQRIEQLNSADLAGTTATLSVDLANSLLTSVTWTAYYATTADTFGTLASPTKTQIATGTFTVSNTVTRYNAQISMPAAATTGIEIVFTVGAQTSGTWTIGNVQLESGNVATPFERRSYGQELALSQRYYCQWTAANELQYDNYNSSTASCIIYLSHPVPMRTTPVLTQIGSITASNVGAVQFTAISNLRSQVKAAASSTARCQISQTAGNGVSASSEL